MQFQFQVHNSLSQSNEFLNLSTVYDSTSNKKQSWFNNAPKVQTTPVVRPTPSNEYPEAYEAYVMIGLKLKNGEWK